jgi:tRNA-2-methylthio-N6-dimethylallyladenosine synthase
MRVRRYHVTTFGCQMNAHDSERIKGMLESLGLGEATTQREADVVIFNTCTIREKPDTRLAAYLGNAAAMKRERPDVVVAVGGCYAEAQRDRIFEQYPFVDVAFGPGSIPHLGDWISAGGFAVPRGKFGRHDHFAADLPLHGERRFQAWVQVSMGCNSKCAYCIVPAVRGREQSRRPGDIVAEVNRLAATGVREITLLGQNVNSWGRDLAPGIRTEFGELLRACDAVSGIERIRFTSPHPKDFRAPVIAAMAECAHVCEHVHLPAQSGSARILKAMRRTYDRERYLRLVDRLRDAIPDLALGTDLIVGFPGETEDDFRETLSLVDEVGFDSAFTFIYSPRAGTEAASLPGQISDEVKHERLERLVGAVQRVATLRNEERIGLVEEVLVEGASRTDPARQRGRTRRNTTVNFSGSVGLGELVDVVIDAATSTTLSGRAVSLVAA